MFSTILDKWGEPSDILMFLYSFPSPAFGDSLVESFQAWHPNTTSGKQLYTPISSLHFILGKSWPNVSVQFTFSCGLCRKYAAPRPIWNAASQILMAAGYVMMAIAFPGSLYIGSILLGICYGVRLAVTVPVASELFGLKYYGLLYNILILNLPLGSFLFSGLLAGYLYDAQATAGSAGGDGKTCIGPHCYRLVFVIMAMACVLGFGLDMLLAMRSRNLYMKIYEAKKFKREMAKYSASTFTKC